jgi:DnaJ-class molecular chaperone
MSSENNVPKKDRCPNCDGDGFETHYGRFGSSSFGCVFCGGTGLNRPARKEAPGDRKTFVRRNTDGSFSATPGETG